MYMSNGRTGNGNTDYLNPGDNRTRHRDSDYLGLSYYRNRCFLMLVQKKLRVGGRVVAGIPYTALPQHEERRITGKMVSTSGGNQEQRSCCYC